MTTKTVTNVKGITLAKGDGADPEVFTDLAGIQDIPQILSSKSVKDRTDVTDTTRDFGLGIAEPPAITLTLFWDPDDTQDNALITEHANGTKSNYQITCPDTGATTYTFKALVSGWSTPYGGVDGDLMWDVNFQLVENDGGAIVTKA